MCTYIHNCWCSVWCGLLITVNVHIAFHDGVFCWIQWTLLIIVNVSALPCSEINAVSCLRAGACDTVTDYSERLLAHIDIPSSFGRLKGQPYRLLITDYWLQWTLRCDALSPGDALLITVNALLTTVNVYCDVAQCKVSDTDYSER